MDNKALSSDLYFLIQRFLSSGPLRKTLQVLNKELEENKILPKRIDWQGNEHDRTIEDMERQFPYIRPDYLLYLCCQANNSIPLPFGNQTRQTFLSFRPKKFDKNRSSNYNQLFNYVVRLHGVPIQDSNISFNIVNSLRGREISGPFSRQKSISPSIYNSIQIQRVTVGHLSAVYCLLFDHSGKYIITGADDLLIKLWSTYTGRLIASFRGASSEITDIAINLENTLLAAGSIDRMLRVWSLQNGAPIAVLTGHTGMITSVNFCPTSCWGTRYLVSTSTDGSVAFWSYNYDSGGKLEFRSTPILYQEKIRPGQAQMICSTFSPGGTFLVAGSVDHHVRVYYMMGDEGPQRILETEAHSDRVDSLQWAHSGLKFLSGSKDGTAIIWWFERQQWRNVLLDMATKLPGDTNQTENDTKKLRVTMVAWDKSDTWVITAVSDNTLKVWSAHNGQLVKILSGHTDEIYVLETHPLDSNIVLSAGHDGQLFVWDIQKGIIIARYLNTVEGQGYGAIFDLKWSPDGNVVAASDSHGNILIFGFGSGNKYYEQLPKELFFHTDYRPLVRDQNYWVLDEQTQVPPHLMPPPFLVDVDGNPYPPMLQRLVPGREHCNAEQLVPNIVIGNEGNQEVIQHVPERLGVEDENLDFRINGIPHRAARRSRDSERIRHSTGDWQSDPNMEWQKQCLVPPLPSSVLQRKKEISEFMKQCEMEEYQRQLRQRPHMICTSTSKSLNHSKTADKRKKNSKYATRPKKTYAYKEEDDHEEEDEQEDEFSESSGYSDWMAEEGLEPPKRSKRRQVIHYPQVSEDDDDDDEEEDEEEAEEDDRDVDKKVSKRPEKAKEKKAKPKINNTASKPSRNNSQYLKNSQPSTSTAGTSGTTSSTASTSGTVNHISKQVKLKVTEPFRVSEWLSETRPRKSPYFPQMGDELVYFIQGHQLYLEAVQAKNIYEICMKELPWNKISLRDHEYVKVIGIQYEIKPPRLCCLKLALLDEQGRLTGKVFNVKYHDMPDVLDFFVLKQMYQTSVSRDWNIGDKFRCMIEDNWWLGFVINKTPASENYPDSTFLCYEIRWTNGEHERMSPWDMEPIDESRLPEDENEAVPVREEELNSILYKPIPQDWPGGEKESIVENIIRGITQVMELAIAEPFLVPVDVNVYPSYAYVIEYPIDLSTVRARFENNFYRRLTAAQFDIRYLATNAEKFNEKNSIIVKHARILTDLCLKILKSGENYIDVAAIYHQLVDSYSSSNSEQEETIEIIPSTSRTLRSLPNRALNDPNDWKQEAKTLIEAMWECEDSVPFRTPVNQTKYPDYRMIIKNPMDLSTVRDNLLKNKYPLPQDFCNDMRLIFQNSRQYNTNKRSRIYVMTVRLSSIFEEHMAKIINNWTTAKKRVVRRKIVDSEASSINYTSTDDSQDNKEVHINTDSDSDNTPLEYLKSLNSTNTESDSTSQSHLPVNKSPPRQAANQDSVTSDSEDQEEEEDSGECYKPTATRSRRKVSIPSEDDEPLIEENSESSESIDSFHESPQRKTGLRARPRKKVNLYTSDSDNSASYQTRRKRKRATNSDSDSDEEPRTSKRTQNGGYFTSRVSSRGRIRKLTERAVALMKKDKKFI